MAVSIYAKHQDFGIGQELVKQYYKLVEDGLQSVTDGMHAKFADLENDFQRVIYVMKLLKFSSNDKSLVDIIEVNYAKRLLKSENDKNDYFSMVFLKHGIESMQKDDTYLTLYDFTKAVFHAASKIQLALAFAHRSEQLFRLGLIREAKSDAKAALPNLELKTDKAKIRIVLGRCYRLSNKIRKAKNEFKKVIRLLQDCQKPNEKELKESALLEIKKCEENIKRFVAQSPLFCYRPKLPIIKNPDRNVLFRHSRTPRLWTAATMRNVEAGEILAVVKPFANPLSSNMTKYCFVCLKRCHNLLPCKNCANVGFCSKMCARKAGKNKLEGDRYPNRHKYDCNGILPVIFNCLNESKPSQFCSSLSHTVFNCIANTKLRRLTEYMNTGGKHKDGKWHAAFKGITDIRTIHPNIWDSSNYASVAWLHPCTDGWKKTKGKYGSILFDFTIASIFLAYCLYISGYPMNWHTSIDNDLNTRFLDKPPATWIAACFLYHFQATAINSFRCTDFIFWQDFKRREYLSCGIYPSLSLINHSCNPSAEYRFTTDGAAVLIATRNLKAGSEITIAYNVTYAEANTQNRRQVLKESFFFECMCEACQDDWNDDNPQELIKCAVCHFESGVTTDKCPMCRLNLPAEEGLKVIVDSQTLIEEVKYGEWTDELQKRFAFLINKANSLLASPSKTVTLLKETLLEKVDEKVAMWIEEPWQFNFFTYMEPGKSLFSQEDRWQLLD